MALARQASPSPSSPHHEAVLRAARGPPHVYLDPRRAGTIPRDAYRKSAADALPRGSGRLRRGARGLPARAQLKRRGNWVLPPLWLRVIVMVGIVNPDRIECVQAIIKATVVVMVRVWTLTGMTVRAIIKL
eukprot:366217-Chlamydomonas_euryale.AAC.15